MISIKRLLYGLKKRYGVKVDFYQQSKEAVDILTGRRTVSRTKYHIRRAVYLEQNQNYRNSLLPKANPIIPNSGLVEIDNTELLIDGKDFPKSFTPTVDDYVIINDQRYEIKSIHVLDKDQSYYFLLKEYKGTIKYQIHERFIKDHLQLIHILKPIHTIQWTIILSTDELFFTDVVSFDLLYSNTPPSNDIPYRDSPVISTITLNTDQLSFIEGLLFTCSKSTTNTNSIIFQETLLAQLLSNGQIILHINLNDNINFIDNISYSKVFTRSLIDTIPFINVTNRNLFITLDTDQLCFTYQLLANYNLFREVDDEWDSFIGIVDEICFVDQFSYEKISL